jgi:hypothetical protein
MPPFGFETTAALLTIARPSGGRLSSAAGAAAISLVFPCSFGAKAFSSRIFRTSSMRC